MQIVIDIPDEVKEAFDSANIADVDCYVNDYDLLLGKAIKNCIPLPKGHGRLIDENTLLKYGYCPNSCDGTTTCTESYKHLHCPIRVFDIESIHDTPTVIEADKEN